MLDEDKVVGDGMSLARSVRALAAQARRTLNDPADGPDARELLEKIDGLERLIDARSSEGLSRWVASLRRKVEDHAMAAV